MYRAVVAILTDDPDNKIIQIPIMLVVPAFQRGVNAGGPTYTDRDGDVYLADRPWVNKVHNGVPSVGPFGFEGPGKVHKTTAGISGTRDDPKYRDLREGMTAYRFTVPNGIYQVDLSFAEHTFTHPGDRVFNVTMEDERVLHAFDVVDEAGGRRTALDVSIVVEVVDGQLDIEFDAPRGHTPIVNAIFISELPFGSPRHLTAGSALGQPPPTRTTPTIP